MLPYIHFTNLFFFLHIDKSDQFSQIRFLFDPISFFLQKKKEQKKIQICAHV